MPNAVWLLLSLAASAACYRLGLAQPCSCPCIEQTHCRCVDQSAPNATDSQPCLNGSVPCLTLTYALLTDLQSDTCVLVSGGIQTHSDSPPRAVSNVFNLAIIGEGQHGTTVVCENSSGLAFINVTGLNISNLSFVNCEAERNSTTYYDDNEMPEVFLVGIYCWLCVDVTLDYVQVSDSSGVGVVFYETGGNNNILNSVFARNRFPNDSNYKGGGGGVTVEYPFSPPGTLKEDCNNASAFNNSNNSMFQFNNCTFEDNRSFLKNSSEYTFIRPGLCSHIAFGRGGGLTIYFRHKAQGNQVRIKYCTFARNEALFGGGLLSEFQDEATNNRVSVNQSHFLNNTGPYTPSVGTSGGGMRVGFTFLAEDESQAPSNSFVMETVTFIGNKAYIGGGVSLITSRQQQKTNTTSGSSFSLRNCTWINNTARLGAAMDVTKWGNVPDGVLPNVTVMNCTFMNNSVHYLDQYQIGIVGCGVVYADSVPITFAGSVEFRDNFGSGIAVRSTYVSFRPQEGANSSALFHRNEARDGGGIAIYGDAWIEVHPSYALIFHENHAYYRGGAIFYEDIGNRNLLSSRRCFIQYSEPNVPRQQWNAYFEFVNNTARANGHSIFCTSLIPCVWGGVSGSGSLTLPAIQQTLNWNQSIFNYECFEGNCTNEIASGPSNATRTGEVANNKNETYFVFSGKRSDIPFVAIDDLHLKVNALFSISSHDNVRSDITSEGYTVKGCPSSTGTQLTFFSIEELPLRVKVNVSISECPPGFSHTGPDCTCVCPLSNDHIASCDSSNMTVMLRQGHWMGCLGNNSSESPPLSVYSGYVYSYCASMFCNRLQLYKGVPLLNDTRQTCNDLNDHICNYTGQMRAGVLCSKCREDYGLSLTSREYDCVPCPAGHSAAAFFILLSAEVLPMLLFIIVIMIFDVNILSAPIYSFVFLCQVKHILLPHQPYEVNPLYTYLSKGDRFLSGLLNLQFFGLFIAEKTCISRNLQVLDILLIRYAILCLPIGVILIVLVTVKIYTSGYCCGCMQSVVGAIARCMNRLRGKSMRNRSILHGLCGFLVLAYADLVEISTVILTPAHLYNADESVLQNETRVQVQGDVYMYSKKHLPYALVAICVLVVVVVLPCFLLLTRPLLPQLLVYCQVGEKRPFKWIVAFYGSNRLKPIFDCFQGPFKPKMGFFAGLFLLYRIAFLLVFVGSEKFPTHLLLGKLLLIFIIFSLHSFFHPYREDKKFANKVDTFMFLLMGALVAMVYFNDVENSHKPASVNEARLWAQLVIQYLPYAYLVLLALWYTRGPIERQLRKRCKKTPLLRNVEMEESLNESYGAFDEDRNGRVQARDWLDDENAS